MHVRGGESFSGRVCDPVMMIVVTRREKVAPLTVKGITDGKSGVTAVTVMREVWELYAISQEEVISPFLHTQFRPIYCGRLHPQLCPCLRRSSVIPL